MTNKSIFDFKNYKLYLKHIESIRKNSRRGFRASLARAANCQTAYISQILNGNANLSLEQSESINRLLIHSKEESRFFLLLVEYSRAGTQNLRHHFLELIEEQLQKHLNLTERFKVKKELSFEDQVIYYSEWTYAAIHIATTIPQLQNAESLSDFFQISHQKVQKVLKFLVSTGLVVANAANQYTIGKARLHLGRDSNLLSKNHTNWRLQTINLFDSENETNLHFTSVASLSYEDVIAIKARLIKEIETYNAIVKDSKEETLYCLSLDFFSLLKKQI